MNGKNLIRKLFLYIKTFRKWKFHYADEIFCFAILIWIFSYIVLQNLSFDFRHDGFTFEKHREQKLNIFLQAHDKCDFIILCDGINYEFNAA